MMQVIEVSSYRVFADDFIIKQNILIFSRDRKVASALSQKHAANNYNKYKKQS